MKLNRWIPVIAAGGLLFFWSGCTDLKDDLPLPVAPGVNVHPSGWAVPNSSSFHGDAIRNADWDMRPCKSCHGASYTGGTAGVSCRTCHTNPTGPEYCTTCHGGVNNNPAPPKDLNGNIASTEHGVGAHQRHLTGGGAVTSYTLACSECHVVPNSVYSPGHVDSPQPAELTFGGLLVFADPSDVPGPPSYNSNDFTCSNTFCHGTWSLDSTSARFPGAYSAARMLGANRSALWTGGASEVACGTCHGTPPTGHQPAQLSECGGCHDQIVNTAGKIADKVKHVNGKINVFGQEWNF